MYNQILAMMPFFPSALSCILVHAHRLFAALCVSLGCSLDVDFVLGVWLPSCCTHDYSCWAHGMINLGIATDEGLPIATDEGLPIATDEGLPIATDEGLPSQNV